MTAAPSRGRLLLCLALCAVPYLVGLGTPALWDHNEPLYAQPPKEVLEGAPFLAPTCNGVTYYPHPPLSTWITYVAYTVLGPSELGHRLPMALATLVTIFATFSIGRRLGGERIGVIAALVLAGSPKFWLLARQLSGDVYLVALGTSAVALALPHLMGETRLRRYMAANVLIGVAFLAKGPVVLVLYGGAVLFAWFGARPRLPFRHLRPVTSVLVTLAVGAPWFVGMALTHDEFIAAFFGRYTVDRFFGDLGFRGVTFYLVALLGDAQPWIVLLPFALWRRRGRRGTLGERLPGALALWTLVFFSLSAGKRNVYMLPLYPMLAVMVAPVLEAAWRGRGRGWLVAAGALLGTAALVAGACLWLMQGNEPRIAPDVFVPIGVLGVSGVALWVAALRRSGRAVVGLALASALAALTATALSLDALDRFRPVPALADTIRASEAEADAQRPVITFATPVHSMRFYLGRPTRVAHDGDDVRAHMGPRTEAYVLVYEHRVERLRKAVPELAFEELARGPELRFNFANNVLGRRRSTRDLVLYLARGTPKDAPPRPAPVGGCE
ncbi:MAG: glycosyltransferase family 39 protein [Planctomycetota bacterium]|nr:glycosyltransferase family 39 protein [Planctomycetota bacterium]